MLLEHEIGRELRQISLDRFIKAFGGQAEFCDGAIIVKYDPGIVDTICSCFVNDESQTEKCHD